MKRRLQVAFVGSLAAAVASVGLAGAASSGATDSPAAQPKRPGTALSAPEPQVDKLIVQWRTARAQPQALDAGRVSALAARAGVGMKALRPVAGGAHVLQLERPLTLAAARAAAARIAQDPDVAYAEPNVRFRVLRQPNEPRFAEWQWNLFAPTTSYTGAAGASSVTTTAMGGANLPAAWDTIGNAGGVTVAIVDTGIVNHPDLNGLAAGASYQPSGRFLPGYDFVSSDNGAGLPAGFVANDGDGRDADPSDPGDWITAAEKQQFAGDCAVGETPPYRQSDSTWHGTHMAGLAAATADNALGIAGVAWNVRIVPVRALGKCGGDLSDIADAVRWAAGLPVAGAPLNVNPAQVISLSLGGGDTCGPTMQAAVDAANAAGAVVVAATGNDGAIGLISPANCSGVVAVTAHAINGENASYANIGAGTTLSAPGGGSPDTLGAGSAIDNRDWDGYYVYSTVLFGPEGPLSADGQGFRGAAYAGFVGTSVATPQVAGVAALLKSVQPAASPAFVRAWLGMADRVRPHPLNGSCSTQLRECGRGLLDAERAVQGAVEAIPAVTVSAAARSAGPGGSIALSGSFNAFPGRTLQSAVWSTTGGTLSATTGTNVVLTLPASGAAEVSLTATDSSGRSARDAVTVRVNRAPTLNALAPQSASVGQVLAFRVSASDADGDALSYSQDSGSTVPARSLDAAGNFSWNTAGATAGTYQLVYSASDGIASSAPGTVTIALSAATAPPPGSSAVAPAGGGGGALPLPTLALLLGLLLARRLRQRE